MDYAIIQLKGAQYWLKAGDKVTVNGTLGEVGKELSLGTALAVKDNGDFVYGKPVLTQAVSFKVLDHVASPKIRVATYKAKSRYRKANGHRQQQTILELMQVGEKPVASSKTAKASTATKKAAPVKKSTATQPKASKTSKSAAKQKATA